MGARVAERRAGAGLNRRAARGGGRERTHRGGENEGRRREEEDDGKGRGFRLRPAVFLHASLFLLRGEARAESGVGMGLWALGSRNIP